MVSWGLVYMYCTYVWLRGQLNCVCRTVPVLCGLWCVYVFRLVCICLCERGLNTACLTNCFHNLGTDWSLPGREWSPACRLWLKIALLLYMRFPIQLPIPFIYGVEAPWYTCLELVEITFGKKERHSQSLGAINLTGSLSFFLSLAFFLFPSLHLSAPTLSFSLLLTSILSLSLLP